MKYYQIFLKNGNEVFVEADWFEIVGPPNGVSFFAEEGLVAYFKLDEIIGCTKVDKKEVDEILNYWKENDDDGKRCDS